MNQSVPLILFVAETSVILISGFPGNFWFLDSYCLLFFFFLILVYVTKLKSHRAIMIDNFIQLQLKKN